MAKEAPAKLTGGAGFEYEDYVAARLLVDLMGGISTLGPDAGRPVRLDWQARDAGWLLDDLALTLDSGGLRRTAALSVKSHRQVNQKGFPANFVEAAWDQWLGITNSSFAAGRDLLGLVTGKLANEVAEAWDKTLREALKTPPDRMVARLTAPATGRRSQSSQAQRAIFESLRCPAKWRGRPSTDDEATIRLLKHLRVIHLDFQSEPSRDEAAAVADCARLVRSGDADEGRQLWESLLRIAADHRTRGGGIDLPGVIAALRGRFHLREHPDYTADWAAIDRSTEEVLGDIRTAVGDVASLRREGPATEIENMLANTGVCVAAGESGCGKSALAKIVATRRYRRVAAIPADAVDSGRATALERKLGLAHPLRDVLRSSPDGCLVVLDGVDRLSEQGRRLVGTLIAAIHAEPGTRHVHFLLTTQFDSARQVIERLAEAGVDRSRLDVLPIAAPTDAEITEVLSAAAGPRWMTLRREMRPLLRNLKVLDWVLAAVRGGAELPVGESAGLTALIDRLWERWVDEGGGYGRSGLLKRLGTLEGETLAAGVPLTHLEHAERESLKGLVSSDLIRVRNERARFAHDLLGDWARLKVLVGEGPPAAPDAKRRWATARWHRAVRLFGQRALEQDGVEAWSAAIRHADDRSPAGTVVRDLLLEAVVLSENSRRLLQDAWPVLISSAGLLLRRLLDRFLFVATVPDARLLDTAGNESSAQLEVLFRVPFWPYWGAMLETLLVRSDDVIRLAPVEAAKVCRMWLEKTPWEVSAGRPLRWRREAAELALLIARDIQARREEREYITDGGDRIAYEAALLAASARPDKAAALALELAGRRPPAAAVREPAEQEAEEQSRLREQVALPFGLGPLREPWPDGPVRHVEDAFREAVLESSGILFLAAKRADVALEVLLAVCIEGPQHEDYFGGSDLIDDFGIEHWQGGYPPLYVRGPFLRFLREHPRQGVQFTLRLVNFASQRWLDGERRRNARREDGQAAEEDLGVAVPMGDVERRWVGDVRVFRWHLDWPLDSKILSCALMSLEKWLQELLDEGEPIDPWLEMILAGSGSVAFAGLLCDVGKRDPDLFRGALAPLLAVSQFHFWDHEVLTERSSLPAGMVGWWNEPEPLAVLARDWHSAPYRKNSLTRISILFLFRDPAMRPFFDRCRGRWRSQLDPDGEPRKLQMLIAQLDPANYTETPAEGGQSRIEFVPPAGLMARDEPDVRRAGAMLQLLTFPTRCHQILEGQQQLPEAELEDFWSALTGLELLRGQSGDDEEPRHIADGVSGGIDVLITSHREWLREHPDREAWCFERLREFVETPPPPSRYDTPDAAGDWRCDRFVAESAVALLAEMPDSPFLRSLVAMGVAAYHYSTTGRTMAAAHRRRDALGPLFDSLQDLALRWSAERRLRLTAKRLETDVDVWQEAHRALIDGFVNGTVEPTDAVGIAEWARSELADVTRKRHGEAPGAAAAGPTDAARGRVRLRQVDPGLDLKVVQNAFLWLDPTTSDPDQQRKVLARVTDLRQLVLGSLPAALVEEDSGIDGLPTKFDDWVFSLTAKAVASLPDPVLARSLWEPVLSLGPAAHEWVERFFWHWFTDGVIASSSPEAFVGRWSEMIRYFLGDEQAARWSTPGTTDDLAYELLGFHFGPDSVAGEERFAEALAGIADVLELAARRWFRAPRVANGFARSVIRPAYAPLLCRGVRWLHGSLGEVGENAVRRERNLDSNLLTVLQVCWDRHHQLVEADPELRAAFLGLLTGLTARNNHAAMALRDRVLDSLPGG